MHDTTTAVRRHRLPSLALARGRPLRGAVDRARVRTGDRAVDSHRRDRPVVEREHGRAQLHPSAVLSRAAERRLFGVPQPRARRATASVARASPRASRGTVDDAQVGTRGSMDAKHGGRNRAGALDVRRCSRPSFPASSGRVYLPGWSLGLGLCFLQGHFEHARGTTSHYGRLYNVLFFNDGYHVEHHARPGALGPTCLVSGRGRAQSRWPAVLRWLDWFTLESLERLVLRSASFAAVRRRGARTRDSVLCAALLPPVGRVAIVGGGLFPRTALMLQRLLPDASIVIIEANAANLELRQDDPRRLTSRVPACELLGRPANRGRRSGHRAAGIPGRPRGASTSGHAAPAVLVHDWLWNRRGIGTRVSWLLCKRLNLVRR